MNVTRSYVLQPWQTPRPVLHHEAVTLPVEMRFPDDDALARIFPGGSHSLKTWGRAGNTKVLDPHWIGVRKPTPMHVDPAYPRYSHHLVLRCDGMWVWGMAKEKEQIVRGSFFILDGHSPHQLAGDRRPKGSPPQWYVAVSYDTSEEPSTAERVIPLLMAYALSAPLESEPATER